MIDHPHRRRGPGPRILALEALLAVGAIALLGFVGWDAGGRAVVRTPALPLITTALTTDHPVGFAPAGTAGDPDPAASSTRPDAATRPDEAGDADAAAVGRGGDGRGKPASNGSSDADREPRAAEVVDDAPGPPVAVPESEVGTDDDEPIGLGPAEEDAPRPVGLRLPSISVDIEVIPLGLQDDGTLEVPADAAVSGWWTGGSDPGERGPAVIAAHVDSYEGPGAFFRLTDLEAGDTASVDREDGTTVTFVVDRIEVYPKDEFPTDEVYGDTDEPTLRLITCGGAFDHAARSYDDNVIVYLDLDGWS